MKNGTVIEGSGVNKIAIVLGLVAFGVILCNTFCCYDRIRQMLEPLKY